MKNSPAQTIKERLTIEDVVSSYIKLERSGANFKARCPFHNEKTPSFFVSPERGSYYCFGCSASGDIFSFVENFEGLDFMGALKLLADRAGISLAQYEKTEDRNEKEQLYKVLEEATKYFEQNLVSQKSARDYLMKRGLTEKTIQEFRIGFAVESWRSLSDHLTKKGFKLNEIINAGLIKKGEKGYYDRFRSRIMFPIMDSSGRVIAFSGRIFGQDTDKDKTLAKYVNSPETVLFKKSGVLYGIDKAKEAIRKNNFSILVEGQMDLIMSHQSGFRNTVAASGTALSERDSMTEDNVSNITLIRRLSNNIVLAFDADKAGISASDRAAKIALSLGMDVKIAKLPLGVDPADLILSEGPNAWKQAIRESEHIIIFLTNVYINQYQQDKRKAARLISEKVLPYLAQIESSIEQSYFIKKISDLSQIPEKAISEDLKKIKIHGTGNQEQTNMKVKDVTRPLRKTNILRKVLGILYWQEGASDSKLDVGHIYKEVKQVLGESYELEIEKFRDERNNLIFEAEVFYGDLGKLNSELHELLLNLKEEQLKEQLEQYMHRLKKAESDGKKEEANKYLKELQAINKEIHNLKIKRESVDY